MTVLYSDSFDNDAAGALPSGWTAIQGTWQVSTTNAASGQALRDVSGNNLDVVLYTSQSITDGTLTFDMKMLHANTESVQNILTPVFRCAADYSTGYYLGLQSTDATVSLYKRVSGSYAQVGQAVGVSQAAIASYAVGDIVRIEVRFVGSTLEFRYWNLTANGTRPSTAQASFTDTSYASGYAGVAVTDTTNSKAVPSLDNFAIADTATGSVTISRNDPALFYSPSNWCDDGTSHMSANTGAYVKFNFTGTSLTMLTTALSNMSAYPQVRAIIDGTAYNIGLSTATSFLIATGLSSGTHTCELYLRSSLYSAGSWWNLANALKITGFQIDSGASASAYSARPNVLYAFGDSLTQAYFLDGGSSPANDDALGNYVSPLAEALNAEYGQVGWGGSNFAAGGVSDVPAFNTSYALIGNGYSRLSNGQFVTQPTYVTVMLGTNGVPAQADVATVITNLRAAAPNAWLFFIVPGSGAGRAPITAAVAAANDAKVILIDAGTRYQAGIFIASAAVSGGTEAAPADGVHYGRRTNARLGAAWIEQIALAVQPRRFTITGN